MIPLGSPGFARRIFSGLGSLGHPDPTFFQTILFLAKWPFVTPEDFLKKQLSEQARYPKCQFPMGQPLAAAPKWLWSQWLLALNFFKRRKPGATMQKISIFFPKRKISC